MRVRTHLLTALAVAVAVQVAPQALAAPLGAHPAATRSGIVPVARPAPRATSRAPLTHIPTAPFQSTCPWLAAHRGEPVLAAEDTLPSFQAAIDGGARTIEMDVQFTSDDVPVLMHDPTVDRTTNGTGPVSSYTFAQLEMLDAGDGAVVPSFASVLDLARSRGVDVVAELKLDHATPDNVAAYLAAIHDSGMAGSVTVESFYAANLAGVQAVDPSLPLAFITTTATTPAAIVALHAGTVLIELPADTPRRTADYHAAGVKVWVWTVDSAADLATADRDGADAVLTDDFAALTAGRTCTSG